MSDRVVHDRLSGEPVMGFWQAVSDVLAEEFSDLSELGRVVRILVRLALAAALGGLLGWDRERTGKPAGLRTHMLVAVGSALFVLTAQQAGFATADLSRVIQGIVTGIGFIGGGAILKLSEERQVRGLTTAADIWLTAGLGIAAGLGWWVPAVLGAAFAFVIVALLRPIERRLEGARRQQESGQKVLVPGTEERKASGGA
jgi:putative Mg2+ transporter-C (MgtC) family protein